MLRPLMSAHSLLTTDEDVHLRAHKLLMPAFNGVAPREPAVVSDSPWWFTGIR